MSPVVNPVDVMSSGLKRPAPVVMHSDNGGELEVSERSSQESAQNYSDGFQNMCQRHLAS